MNDSPELTLTQVLGLPKEALSEYPLELNERELLDVFSISLKNRVPLFFLSKANRIYANISSIHKLYLDYRKKADQALKFIAEVCKVLNLSNVNYAVFKTLKPFPFTSVDIDILLFNSESLSKAYTILLDHGCVLAGYGPHSATLYNANYEMNVDLQSEISISQLVYVSKDLLRRHLSAINLNGVKIPAFDQNVELVLIIAHSFYKEQLFTLADYYSTTIRILQMSPGQHENLAKFAEEASVQFGVKLFLNLACTLTRLSFREEISALTHTAEIISANDLERRIIHRVIRRFEEDLQLPFRYPTFALAEAFIKKVLIDRTMRSGLIKQSIQPFRDNNFIKNLLHQVKRQSY